MNLKKVTFNDNVKVHYMYVWLFASHNACLSISTIIADRHRFAKRILETEIILQSILQNKIKQIFQNRIFETEKLSNNILQVKKIDDNVIDASEEVK